jgi:hypothetical protein
LSSHAALARPSGPHHRSDRRRSVPAGSELMAVEDDERLAGEVGQVDVH